MASLEVEVNPYLPQVDEIISTKHHRYTTNKLLGKGGFGAVFMVTREDGKVYAMKCETADVRKPVLMMDCKVLRGASQIKSRHFCVILDRGKVEDRFKFLVMTMVGANLWDLRMDRDPPKFTLNTALKTAEQCLMAIADLHTVGFLHRDIKPGNFAVGRPETVDLHTVFMLDFGLCRKYIGDKQDKDLRMPRNTAPFRGTTRYASIAALKQQEQSRKDDIEAWLYMVVEWATGAVPWRNLKGSDKAEVLQWKIDVRKPPLTEEFFNGLPYREFSQIMAYIDNLKYHNIPDYDHIHYCLAHAYKVSNISPSDPLDWDPTVTYHGPTWQPNIDREKQAAEVKNLSMQSKSIKEYSSKKMNN